MKHKHSIHVDVYVTTQYIQNTNHIIYCDLINDKLAVLIMVLFEAMRGYLSVCELW